MPNTGIGNIPSAGGGSANIPKALQEQPPSALWPPCPSQEVAEAGHAHGHCPSYGISGCDITQDKGFQDVLRDLAQDMGFQDVTFPMIWDFRMCSRIVPRIWGFRCLGCESSDVWHRWAALTLQDKPSSHGPYPHTSYGLGVFEVTTTTFQSAPFQKGWATGFTPDCGKSLC